MDGSSCGHSFSNYNIIKPSDFNKKTDKKTIKYLKAREGTLTEQQLFVTLKEKNRKLVHIDKQ